MYMPKIIFSLNQQLSLLALNNLNPKWSEMDESGSKRTGFVQEGCSGASKMDVFVSNLFRNDYPPSRRR
jgi:hypothetical protein